MKTNFVLKNKDFLLAKERCDNFANYLNIEDYVFNYNESPAFIGTNDDKTLIIHGIIVNSHDSNSSETDIVNELLESINFNDFISRSKKMAGRFVLIYRSKEGFFVLPDATASIQVAYDIKSENLFISSNPKIIADIQKYDESQISKTIKASAADSQTLPYDLTMYEEIKFVTANHFLNVNNRQSIRYYPSHKISSITVSKAAEFSNKPIRNILKAYHNKFKLSLALTSGVDSRTILAMCKDIIDEIPTYTFYHENFTENTADIYVPKELSKRFGFSYTIMQDLELPEEIVKQYLGKISINFAKVVARNAWTYYNSKLKDHIRLDGQVIPIAKSNFGKNLPEFLAKPFYLVTKTHNHSKENYTEIIRWYTEIDEYSKKSKISKFDLFFWEHRMGNWVGNSLLNSSLLTEPISIFNCRELIEAWLNVPRKERLNAEIHLELIKLNWPELLDFPINPGRKYNFLYKNSLLYYLASFVKHRLDRKNYVK
ncbi:MAG: hypothetical protein WC967_16220 [Balneolaceae bacterium]